MMKIKSVLNLPGRLNWYWFIWFCAQKPKTGKPVICPTQHFSFFPHYFKEKESREITEETSQGPSVPVFRLKYKKRLNKLRACTFQKAIKLWRIWGSPRTTWAILVIYHMHFFFLFLFLPPQPQSQMGAGSRANTVPRDADSCGVVCRGGAWEMAHGVSWKSRRVGFLSDLGRVDCRNGAIEGR